MWDGPASTFTETDFREALAHGEFRPVFQPIISVSTNQMIGFEALARWCHPTAGIISPGIFIEPLERCGLVSRLTCVVLERALAAFSNLRHLGCSALAINLSAKEFNDMLLADRIVAECHKAGVRPESVILELTETAALSDMGIAAELMKHLREKGFRLALDDFGSGYSSMLQLYQLPFTDLKIDRTFVGDIATSFDARRFIRMIVDLAHHLGLNVIAEGVENEAAVTYLREVGCDLAQGYYLGRPMDEEAITGWTARREMADTGGPGRHVCQFHGDAKELNDSVARYIMEGIAKHETVVVFASPERLAAVSQLADQAHLGWARSSRQLVTVDAEQAIAAAARRGVVDLDRLVRKTAGVIDRAADGGRRVRVYGEISGLLARQGFVDQALRLERIADDFVRRRRCVHVYCGYQIDTCDPCTYRLPLDGIAMAHTAVLRTFADKHHHAAVEGAVSDVFGTSFARNLSYFDDCRFDGHGRLAPGLRSLSWISRNMGSKLEEVLIRLREIEGANRRGDHEVGGHA